MVITGELKGKIDRVWDAFWSGGISNPLEVIEQITYLLFIRRLDDLQTIAEKKALLTGRIESPVYLPGQNDLRWSEFSNLAPDVMYRVVSEEVFPFLRRLGDQFGGDGSTYGEHMKDARFTIPTPALLSRVVDMLGEIPMEKRDTNGDLYEYLLSKIASAGVNGQFRTPRHIISLMVDLMAPKPGDEICDPACGTAGFLVAASVHPRAPPVGPHRRDAAGALPQEHVPRVRLRLHHAPHRQHEHAPPRHRGARHPLPRLAVRRGQR